jgi:hypothetical protein
MQDSAWSVIIREAYQCHLGPDDAGWSRGEANRRPNCEPYYLETIGQLQHCIIGLNPMDKSHKAGANWPPER